MICVWVQWSQNSEYDEHFVVYVHFFVGSLNSLQLLLLSEASRNSLKKHGFML